jgi:hypothetical protein
VVVTVIPIVPIIAGITDIPTIGPITAISSITIGDGIIPVLTHVAVVTAAMATLVDMASCTMWSRAMMLSD